MEILESQANATTIFLSGASRKPEIALWRHNSKGPGTPGIASLGGEGQSATDLVRELIEQSVQISIDK